MQNGFRFRERSDVPRRGLLFGLSLFAGASLCAASAGAEDVKKELVGAWAEPGNCDATFVTKGGKWAFREPRDMGGLGFIVFENQYDGPFGQCSLTSITHKGDKDVLNLSCHNTVGYFDQAAPIEIVSDSQLKIFSALDGMSTTYQKCSRQ